MLNELVVEPFLELAGELIEHGAGDVVPPLVECSESDSDDDEDVCLRPAARKASSVLRAAAPPSTTRGS